MPVICLVADDPRCTSVVPQRYPAAGAFVLDVPNKHLLVRNMEHGLTDERREHGSFVHPTPRKNMKALKRRWKGSEVLGLRLHWSVELCYFRWLCVLVALYELYTKISVKGINI